MTDAPFDPGQFIFLTKPDCPSCAIFKSKQSVQRALSNGDAVELQPGDEMYDHVREAAGVERLPGVVEYTGVRYKNVG